MRPWPTDTGATPHHPSYYYRHLYEREDTMTFDLEAAKKRCEEATPGPWGIDTRNIEQQKPMGDGTMAYMTGCSIVVEDGNGVGDRYDEPLGVLLEQDAAFIAHARTDLPAAIAHIEWQEKMLERAKGSVTEAADMAYDEGNDRAEAECHAWLRDLEKGPPDAQDQDG